MHFYTVPFLQAQNSGAKCRANVQNDEQSEGFVGLKKLNSDDMFAAPLDAVSRPLNEHIIVDSFAGQVVCRQMYPVGDFAG